MVRRAEQNGKWGKAGGIRQQEALNGSDKNRVNKVFVELKNYEDLEHNDPTTNCTA